MLKDPRLSELRNRRRDALLRQGLSYARQGIPVAGALSGIAESPLIASGSFGLLIGAIGVFWPRTQSFRRAVIVSSPRSSWHRGRSVELWRRSTSRCDN